METIDTQQFKEAIGKEIYRLRKEKGYSSRKFAVLADMEHHQVLSIEKGNTDMRLSTFIKICNALETTPQELIKVDRSL